MAFTMRSAIPVTPPPTNRNLGWLRLCNYIGRKGGKSVEIIANKPAFSGKNRGGGLLFAVQRTDPPLVVKLVLNGAPVDERGPKGDSAIRLAESLLQKSRSQVESAHLKMTRILDFLTATRDARFAMFIAGEWRPHLHYKFPLGYREAMRTLVVLAKARDVDPTDSSHLVSHYPQACLDLLPEEVLQFLFALVTSEDHVQKWIVPVY